MRKKGAKHACAMRRLENSLCQPSSECLSFSNKGQIRQRKERDRLSFSSAVSKIQWDSNPTTAQYLAMGNLYLFKISLRIHSV